jgi:hypothetical protein
VLGFVGGADNLIDSSNLRKLIERNIPFANLEDAPIPVHVVATNLGGVAIWPMRTDGNAAGIAALARSASTVSRCHCHICGTGDGAAHVPQSNAPRHPGDAGVPTACSINWSAREKS